MIITIDGPAGSGKSTAARGLATRLGFEFLDTGAMFRTVALAALRAGTAWTDDSGLDRLLASLKLQMLGTQVLLDGEDVAALIRTPEVSEGASVVAASAVVRPHLARMQREIARGRNMVCEGRDQGTVVFPDAGCKFYLVADPEERLQRRVKELQGRGQTVDVSALRKIQSERDERDAGRELAPMKPAEDAVILDTSGLSVEEVVERMEQIVRQRMAAR